MIPIGILMQNVRFSAQVLGGSSRRSGIPVPGTGGG